MKAVVLIVAASALAATASLADVYKWTDASGRVHYSDKPRTVAAEKLKVRSARTDYQRLEADRQAAIERAEVEAEEAVKSAEKEARQAEVERVRTENCERARRNLNRVNAAQRLYEVEANGERRYLSEAEIESRRQSARDDVATYCDD